MVKEEISHLRFLDTDQSQGKSLQFSSGQQANISILDLVEFENVHDMLHIAHLALLLDQRLDCLEGTFDSSRQLIHILWLDHSLEVVLEHLGEVVLEFRATEISQYFLPVWRVVISS
jgi:hypothetical protein